jgi:hypothetical protein
VRRIWLDRYSWGSCTKAISISVSKGPHVIWHANRSGSCNSNVARAKVASIENLIDRYTGVRPTVPSRSRQWPSNFRLLLQANRQPHSRAHASHADDSVFVIAGASVVPVRRKRGDIPCAISGCTSLIPRWTIDLHPTKYGFII